MAVVGRLHYSSFLSDEKDEILDLAPYLQLTQVHPLICSLIHCFSGPVMVLLNYDAVFSSPVHKYRELLLSLSCCRWCGCEGHTLKFHIKDFLCDWQGAVS